MSNTAYRFVWSTAALLCGAYLLIFLLLAPLPLQDYPNHLARAFVMNDLLFHDGARFGAVFEYHFLAVPYILNDWLLSLLIEFGGEQKAAAAWPAVVFLSLPCALLYYMRNLKIQREQQVLAFLLSLYLATNAFFLRGFLAFSLGLASILTVVAQVRMMRERTRPGLLLYMAYSAALAAAYLIHLTTLVFIAAAVGATALLRLRGQRSFRWRREFLIYLPIAMLMIWHFLLHDAVPGLGETENSWGSVLAKFQHLDWDFIRFTRRSDRVLLCIGIFACVWQRFWRQTGTAATLQANEMALLALVFVAIYFALPPILGNATWVDVRALPLIAVFAMLACLTQLDDALSQPRKAVIFVGIASAAVLALANLIYLASHLQRLEQKITDYRAVIAVLPKDSWVFPVYTNITERPIKSTFHAASFALIDRQALTPYLFSRNLGDPMQYFSYRNKPYAPDEDWYTDVHSEPVDWQAIARDYDFVLVTKPFDLRRIPISTGPIFENSAAALFTTGRTTSISAQGTAH